MPIERLHRTHHLDLVVESFDHLDHVVESFVGSLARDMCLDFECAIFRKRGVLQSLTGIAHEGSQLARKSPLSNLFRKHAKACIECHVVFQDALASQGSKELDLLRKSETFQRANRYARQREMATKGEKEEHGTGRTHFDYVRKKRLRSRHMRDVSF